MKRTFYWIMMMFTSALLLTGCGQSGFGPIQSGVSYFAFGDTVSSANLRSKPQRIVSLNIRSDEILLALVPPERVIALSRLADDDGISNITGEAKQISQRVTLNAEQLIFMHPDLVLATQSQPPELIQTLRDAGIIVHVHKTPHKIGDVETVIRQTAEAVGEKEGGERLIQQMEAEMRPINTAVDNIPSEERVKLVRFTLLGGSGGKGTSFDEICRLAGVQNGASVIGVKNGQQLSKEQIIRFNPEVLILPTWGYTTNTNMDEYAADILNDPALQQVKAVQNKRVVIIEDRHMLSTSQYMVECVKDVFRAAYPERAETIGM